MKVTWEQRNKQEEVACINEKENLSSVHLKDIIVFFCFFLTSSVFKMMWMTRLFSGSRKKGFAYHSSMKQQSVSKRDSFEMVKRRVRAPVSMFDRPLLTEVEFVVDARYRSLTVIGSGSFGVVAGAHDTKTNQRVAIKKILSAFATSKSARYVLREVRLLRHINHPNIVRLLDIDVPYQYRAWDEVYIVTPMLHTDLRAALNNRVVKTVTQKKKIAFDLLCALEYMHGLGLMHRDVKTRNLLLDKNLNAQLCDLGHSRFYSKSNNDLNLEFEHDDGGGAACEPELSGSVTTMIQSAPEIGLGAPYSVAVDIWAAGCVIGEMIRPGHETMFDLTGRHSHMKEILEVVGHPTPEELKEFPDHSSFFMRFDVMGNKGGMAGSSTPKIAKLLGPDADPLVVDLLENMLRFSPSRRPSATQALEHPWFDEVRRDRTLNIKPYDFQRSEPPRKTNKAELKELVWKEVVAFHPEAPSMGVH